MRRDALFAEGDRKLCGICGAKRGLMTARMAHTKTSLSATWY
jgi:hypothetical protein